MDKDKVYDELTKLCYETMMEGREKGQNCVKTFDEIVIKYYYKTDQIKLKYKGAKLTLRNIDGKMKTIKEDS